MVFFNLLIPFLAAILGGTLNSVAGGGSFLTFPSLIVTNVPPIQANATSSTALWPGSAAAAWAFRKELAKQSWGLLLLLGIISLIGGITGAILLLKTPQKTFVRLIPFLMLAATLLFALSPVINAKLKQHNVSKQLEATKVSAAKLSWLALTRLVLLQLLISIYGGYFGGGIGILMLATLGLMGMEDIHEMNAVKNTLATCINGIAVATFILAGAVFWLNALTMVVGAIIGGYGGASYARKLDPRLVRGFVILVGSVLTIYFLFEYGFL
jgi:uncharacterized protein